MGYHMQNGRFAGTQDLVLLPTAARTATGEGAAVEVGDRRVARLRLTAAVAGEDPSLTVTVVASPNGEDWYQVGAFQELTEDGEQSIVVPCDRYLKAAFTIAGEDAGAFGAVDQTVGDGPGFTVAGTPEIDGTVTVEITTGGAPGTAEFRWSLDDGETWEAEDVTVPTTPFTAVLAGTGATLTFENDTFVEDDAFTFTADDPDPDTVATFSVEGETA